MTTSSANNSDNLSWAFLREHKLTRRPQLHFPLPPALVALAGQHIALEILAAHIAWVKRSKELLDSLLGISLFTLTTLQNYPSVLSICHIRETKKAHNVLQWQLLFLLDGSLRGVDSLGGDGAKLDEVVPNS
ncbi:hypothetical protein Tco_0537770 [Tanacetum coccineum]